MSIYFFFVNKANLVHSFSQYVYFFSLHVSGDYVPITRRNNYLCDTWYLLFCVYDCLVCLLMLAYQTVIHTAVSPDDGHIVARNIQRKEINILRKNCAPSWLYLQDYTGLHGQQNVKKYEYILLLFFIYKPKISLNLLKHEVNLHNI